ncbi:hypothetical protein PMPD1_2932 [Paramixta manurensis]|uniref:YejG-like protein n=1 Tax=Paramixta manurensis TaxID=2740817 RepID=A0A6M8UAX4_9GAMM|nr:hypothetical protein PMPD1_2932 [Erwiniaceae bacterium PD-1]
MLPMSVVHRLPQYYRWSAGLAGSRVEPYTLSESGNENDLIGLKLLSHNGAPAWDVMAVLKAALADIQLECALLEWEGEPCLFVQRVDECAATGRLKNQGVAIAETFSPADYG